MAIRNHVLTLAILVGVGCASSTTTKPATTASAPLKARKALEAGRDAATIDAMIATEWKKDGVVPSPDVDDARFLRRVYLDVIGTIPTADQVTAFARDASPDKRAKVVASLLASPRYAEHWAMYWDDVLMGRRVKEQRVDRVAFRGWLRDEMARNTKWNDLVYALISAKGQNTEGGSLRQQGYGFGTTSETAMTGAGGGMSDGDMVEGESGAPVNPAVNWALKYFDAPQDFAGTASKTFLGVQIQCAQCHDHKTEKWKQSDFQAFASCFSRTQLVVLDKGKTMGNVRRVALRDANRPLPRFTKNPELSPIAKAQPAALDGTDLSKTGDAREAMADWITSDQNPWFAKAIVNRMWAHFVGRGFVNPIDDLRPSNPATMPELLDRLAADFEAHDYDVKHLITLITATSAYQRSSSPPTSGSTDAASVEAAHKEWARFRLAPMGPDELLESVLTATDLKEAIAESKISLDNVREQLAQKYGFLFDVDEEFDHDSFEGTLAQALTLLNGSLTGSGASVVPGNALKEVLALPGDDKEKIEALYLRTVSRAPTPEETAYWVAYVETPRDRTTAGAVPQGKPGKGLGGKGQRNAGGDPLRRLENKAATSRLDAKSEAFEDVMWALLNSSEFLFNH